MKQLSTLLFMALALLCTDLTAQTLMPLPTHTSNFSGNVRGMWFTAPTDFTIVGIKVPTDGSSGDASIACLKFAAIPPFFPTTTNAFTVEALYQNNAGTAVIPVNIPVQTGEFIGFLGSRAGNTSYSSVTSFASNVDGFPCTLARIGMQFPMATTAPQDVWAEAAGTLARLEMWYVTCDAPTPQVMIIGDVDCYGDSTGSAIGSAIGGIAPYTYIWSNGDTNATATGLSAGNWTLSILDSIDCLADTVITIVQNDTIDVTFTNTHNPCFGDALGESTAMPTGGVTPYSYGWSSGGSSALETGLTSGNHTVDVTDAVGCVVQYGTDITSPDSLWINLDTIMDIFCQGDLTGSIGTTTAGGIIPYVLQWDDLNGQISPTAINLGEGFYTLMATDANGCEANVSASINFVNPMPTLDLGADIAANSPFYDITTAPAGFTYLWSTGSNAPTIRVFQTGTYSVTITDDNGCTNTDEIVISKIWASGIDNLGENVTLDVYPNPSQGELTVNMQGWNGANLMVEVTTLSGQQVFMQNFVQPTTSFVQQFNLNGLASGMYLMKFTTESGFAVRRVLME